MTDAFKVTPKLFEHTIYLWEFNWFSYLNQKVFLWSLLSPFEQQKARCFLRVYDKERYIIIKGILRILTGHLLNISPKQLQFKYNLFGKPILMHSTLAFNLSHSKEQVIYAFCKTASVGVDMQYLDFTKPINLLAKRYFSNQENLILSTFKENSKKELFFEGWVKKEAIVKALGTGIHSSLRKIEVIKQKSFQSYNGNTITLYPIQAPLNFKSYLAISSQFSKAVFKYCKQPICLSEF